MRDTKMSKHPLLSQVGSLIYNFRRKEKEIQMKTFTSEKYNNHTLQHPIKVSIPKIINNIITTFRIMILI